MDNATVKQIESDPNFIKLVHERNSLGWMLTIPSASALRGFF
jgi:uncharacterized membrane protein (DUF485 family)